MATLRHIMVASPQDGPRVSSAREFLVRAHQGKLFGGLLGKNEQQRAPVEELVKSGGRFAIRAPRH